MLGKLRLGIPINLIVVHYKSKVLFYLPLFIILVMIYDQSWLPGKQLLAGKEVYINSFIAFIVLVFAFNFTGLFKLDISLYTFEKILMVILLILAIYSSVVINPDEITRFPHLIRIITFGMFIVIYFFLFPHFLLNNPKYFEKFIKLVSNFGFAVALFGLFLFFRQVSPSKFYTYGLTSLIGHPNNTSMVFTITAIPTVFYIYWNWENFTVIKRLYYLISFLIQISAQILTYTRAGMIATVLGLGIFFILYYRRKFFYAVPVILFALPGFLVAFFKLKGFASFISRFYLLIIVYQMIAVDPTKLLWGYGITNSLLEFKKNIITINPLDETPVNDPHNTYATLILMLGIIFTIFFLILIIFLLSKCLRFAIISTKREETLYFIFLFTSALSIFIQGLFDAELVKVEYFTIQYLLIILGLIYLNLRKNFAKDITTLHAKSH